MEEDPELRRKWIRLLATTVTSPDSVLPSFTSILGELSPLESIILDYVYPIVLRLNRIDERLNHANNDERGALYDERSPVSALTRKRVNLDWAHSAFLDRRAFCERSASRSR